MNVVSIGEVLVDWLSLTPGASLLDATKFCRSLGGNATNVAIGLQRLETPVKLIGKIGTDFHGEYLKLMLHKEGLALDWIIEDPNHPTAQCFMTTSADGEHTYRNWPHPHAADVLSEADLPLDILQTADCLHATAISMAVMPRRDAVKRAIGIVREKGGIVSFDAGFPLTARELALEQVEPILSETHILKVNESELYFWANAARQAAIDDVARKLFERYRPIALMVTCAARGSMILTAEHTVRCEPLKVTALSEVGAGDAYISGVIHVLSQLLDGKAGTRQEALKKLTAEQWHDAGLAGNAAGALTTLEENAYAGMPTRQQLKTALAGMNGRGSSPDV